MSEAAPATAAGDAAKDKGNEAFKGSRRAIIYSLEYLILRGAALPSCVLAAKHFAQAVIFYSQAIDADPSVAVYWGNRSFANIKLENYGSALTDAEKAIELDPSYTKAYYRRAEAFFLLRKYKEALRDFKQARRRARRGLRHRFMPRWRWPRFDAPPRAVNHCWSPPPSPHHNSGARRPQVAKIRPTDPDAKKKVKDCEARNPRCAVPPPSGPCPPLLARARAAPAPQRLVVGCAGHDPGDPIPRGDRLARRQRVHLRHTRPQLVRRGARRHASPPSAPRPRPRGTADRGCGRGPEAVCRAPQ